MPVAVSSHPASINLLKSSKIPAVYPELILTA
jgi:hypothetical protein